MDNALTMTELEGAGQLLHPKLYSRFRESTGGSQKIKEFAIGTVFREDMDR